MVLPRYHLVTQFLPLPPASGWLLEPTLATLALCKEAKGPTLRVPLALDLVGGAVTHVLKPALPYLRHVPTHHEKDPRCRPARTGPPSQDWLVGRNRRSGVRCAPNPRPSPLALHLAPYAPAAVACGLGSLQHGQPAAFKDPPRSTPPRLFLSLPLVVVVVSFVPRLCFSLMI